MQFNRLKTVGQFFTALYCAFLCTGVAEAATLMLVANNGTDTVSVVNLESRSTIATFSVGDAPRDITVNGTGAYIPNTGDDTLSVVDTTDYQTIATISVGADPQAVAINGTGAYVVNSGSNSVSVIDITDNQIVTTIAVGNLPQDIAINGTGAYVTNAGNANISVIDITDNQIVTTVSTAAGPLGIGISGTGAFVVNITAGTVSIIDITDNQLVKNVSIGLNFPYYIAINGTGAYITNSTNLSVSVIDTIRGTVAKTLSTGFNGPRSITTTGTGVYVANFNGGSVTIVDTTTSTPETVITGFSSPFGLAIYNDTTTLDPALTIPASVQLCDDLSVEYHLPEEMLAGSATLEFFNATTASTVTATLTNNTGTVIFDLDLEDFSSSANIASSTANVIAAGSHTVTVSYQDQFGNTAADDDASLTVTDCPVSSSSSSSSSANPPSQGVREITLQMKLDAAQKRYDTAGSSASASSSSSSTQTNVEYFIDVSADAWYAMYVQDMAERKIFEGYKAMDGQPLHTFGPADPITLGQLAKIGVILHDRHDIHPQPAGDEWFVPYIDRAYTLSFSVFSGSPVPQDHATRGQVIQTVLEAVEIPLKSGPSPYTDVPANHLYFQAITTGSMHGLISGDDGTTNFRPDEPINRAEVAKIISIALTK